MLRLLLLVLTPHLLVVRLQRDSVVDEGADSGLLRHLRLAAASPLLAYRVVVVRVHLRVVPAHLVAVLATVAAPPVRLHAVLLLLGTARVCLTRLSPLGSVLLVGLLALAGSLAVSPEHRPTVALRRPLHPCCRLLLTLLLLGPFLRGSVVKWAFLGAFAVSFVAFLLHPLLLLVAYSV